MKKIFLALIIVSLLVFGVYLIRKNTDLLTFNPPREEIEKNNFNPPDTSGSNTVNPDVENNKSLNELVPQKLIVNGMERTLYLPQNYQISVYAQGFTKSRSLDFDPQGNLYLTDKTPGDIYLLKPGGEKILVDGGLRNIHGIEWYKNDLFVAEEQQLVVYKSISEDGTYQAKEVLIGGLPQGAGHNTRTIHIAPDEKIYLAVGSSCNVCEESDARRAAILRYNLDGSNEKIFAEGLRNTVGFTFKNLPEGGYEIWGVDNGRDRIGDNLPVEEVNIIKEGLHYGWPYCHDSGIPNPEFPERKDYCQNQTEFPTYNMQAHSAPLGLDFVPQNFTDKRLEDNLIIAFHGSWNRTIPTGYKVVRIDTANPSSQTINFITGWLPENGEDWGRPVDVKFFGGNLYITDDKAGVVYQVAYNKND